MQYIIQLIFIQYKDNYAEQLIYNTDGKISTINHIFDNITKGSTTFEYKNNDSY